MNHASSKPKPFNSLLESSSAGPRPGRLKGRVCNQQGASRGCEDQPDQPDHLVAQRLKAEHMGDDGSGGLGEEEELVGALGEDRGSITVGSCVARDYTMTMRR